MPHSSLSGAVASQLWRRNRTRLRKRLGLPRAGAWMRPYEEDLILDILTILQPKRCLEWGGGYSTLNFPDLLPSDATWTCVEHDKDWAANLAGQLRRPGVTVRFVPPDVPKFTGDGDATSFASYLAAAKEGAPYDFILVDGRARAACIEVAKSLLSPEGVLVLHDANRSAYLGATQGFKQQALFQDRRAFRGNRVAGGVWLGSHGCELEQKLPLDLHRRVWAFYRGIGRLLA
ncbi:MAG: class I SAM-dependent methyltransferase [Gemmatimonadaceae bacterium]|nr:class I SAM-dependent methyltransferase [Gemmatimonadaceae bacterium]